MAVKKLRRESPLTEARRDLEFATATLAKLRGELAGVQEELLVVRAHESDLRADCANLAEALAEATWLLDRCTPGRFRDRELAPRIRAFSALAGREAWERVVARAADDDRLPRLSYSTSSALDPTCGVAPPALYSETHGPCCWIKGHAGDHLWKSTAFDVTGRSEP